eukprot:TRINITY_DN7564_c0_g1_i4.p2 TRINITY_DN7564_c0_g1~~TRINITY_DN7564_c0_g1_i4.p2  ORF type:complete len:101 (-),score=18.27 TRINITY_DN7564_c0_g1_i4:2-304(-)
MCFAPLCSLTAVGARAGADMLLPMLISVCVEGVFEAPMAMIAYIRSTCAACVRYNDDGYNLCMLEAAVLYLANLEEDELRSVVTHRDENRVKPFISLKAI